MNKSIILKNIFLVSALAVCLFGVFTPAVTKALSCPNANGTAHEGTVVLSQDSTVTVTLDFPCPGATNSNSFGMSSPKNIVFGNSKTTPAGTSFNAGQFKAGTELVFTLINNTHGYTFYTGPASRNFDNKVHADFRNVSDNQWTIGFDDGGGEYNNLFNDLVITVTATPTGPTCTPNTSLKCVGNSVYNFDSCGNQGSVYQQCSSDQQCTNGQCVNNCIDHSSKRCSNNSVYWYDSCGTKQDVYQQCGSNQICQNGQCIDQQQPECSTNSDCGTSGYTGSAYCGNGGDVYQDYITYTCKNAGSSNSYCSNSTTSRMKTNCTANQTCSNGSCVDQNIECSTNSDCGVSGYTGSPYCNGGNVYQNYTTYTCNNAGSSSSYCSNNSSARLKTNCGNQTCTNGQCTNNNNCNGNTYQQCSGNYLYTYDSCGNQLNNQYCPNGCSGNSCNSNYNNISVQTNPATNVYNNQATLNGYLYTNGIYNNNNNYNNNSCNYVWFQYGPTTSYGMETNHMSQNYSGNFSQTVYTNNNYTNTYHFRAAAQSCNGQTVYGNDQIAYPNNNNTNSNLYVTETVRNLTSGGSGFATTAYANPGDMVMFMITLQANNGDAQNVFVRDNLPTNLIYNNQMIVACSGNSNCNNYSGSNIASGINLNTIYSGQTATITFQAQVAQASNFSYGSTTLTDSVNASSSNSGYVPTNSASVIVTRAGVYGASTVSTGLTNNFWTDSFILPLAITLLLLWIWRSGSLYGVEKFIAKYKNNKKIYDSQKELSARISAIQKLEA